jgi:hypothetical protein
VGGEAGKASGEQRVVGKCELTMLPHERLAECRHKIATGV